MALSLEEKRKAAAEASRRWRANHPEQAKQVEREAYHRRQAKEGKESKERRLLTPDERRERNRRKVSAWQKANPEKVRVQRCGQYARHREERLAKNRLRQLKRYGLTLEQFAAFGERCGICSAASSGRFSAKTGREYPMHIDHCHDTQRVGGLLCSRCNIGLGYFAHDITRMEQAIDYLKRTA
jgi:hypothetical protein